jgi:hypothetical protein
MSKEIDTVLSGIIILMVIIVIFKWYCDSSSTDRKYNKLSCGCVRGTCRCQKKSLNMRNRVVREGLDPGPDSVENKITGNGPVVDTTGMDNYQEITKLMGVDKDVGDSHISWVETMAKNGMSTGASASTTLEETGRSYGTADYVGLTGRKWCKARHLATPQEDARVTPSHVVEEYCNIDMDELV